MCSPAQPPFTTSRFCGMEELDVERVGRLVSVPDTLVTAATRLRSIRHPRWSPDGEWIAYISNEEGLPQLYLLETYGGERRKIAITSRRWRRPMGRAHVRIVDGGTGALAAARVYAPASDGKFYPPPDAYARVAGVRMTYRSGEHIFHTDGDFVMEAPVGNRVSMRREGVRSIGQRNRTSRSGKAR